MGVFHRKRGLHWVVLYIVVGPWRCPWGFRFYRGKDTLSPAQLGLRWLRSLPPELTTHDRTMVLADRAFSSVEFLAGVRQLGRHALVGMGKRRCRRDGRRLEQFPKPGVQVSLQGWDHPVWVGWYGWKREDGTHVKRYVICTRCLKASTLSGWGKGRWQMEGWFKTAKHRFGLPRFGQRSLRGVCRGLVPSCIAFVLAHWG